MTELVAKKSYGKKKIDSVVLLNVFLMIIMTAFCGLLFLQITNNIYTQREVIVSLSTLISIIGIYFLVKAQGISFASLYLIYLSLAHLGSVTSELLFPGAFQNFRENVPSWFYSELLSDTVALVGISIYFFVVSAILSEKLIKVNENSDIYTLNNKGNKIYYQFGIGLISLYTVYLVYAVLSGNLNIFGTYGDYREARTEFYPWLVFFFRVGIAFSFANGNRKQLMFTSGLIAIPSFIVFMSGSRGEIIYPIAAGVVILFMRGFKPKKKHIMIGLLVFFFVIPVISQTRGSNFGEQSLAEIGLNFTDPFVEAGVILRPFINTYGWIQEGEPYAYGLTYLIPIQNMMSRLPGISRFPLEGSRYFLTERTPSQGYSTLAEAYFNFGLFGLFMWTSFIAWLLTFFRKKLLTFDGLALTGAVFSILNHNIRGHFLSVPAHLTVLLMIFFIIKMLTKVSK